MNVREYLNGHHEFFIPSILIIDGKTYDYEDDLPVEASCICTYMVVYGDKTCDIKLPMYRFTLIVLEDGSIISNFNNLCLYNQDIQDSIKKFIETHTMDTAEGLMDYVKLFKRIASHIDAIADIIKE